MNKITILLFLLCFCFTMLAQPGKDGAYTVSSPGQVLNKYRVVSSAISAGSANLTIAGTEGAGLCAGDLIMVYQAQGASMNTVNNPTYGSIINYNSSGLYEFKYVQSVLGNVVTVQTTFTNSYQLSGRPQVIKVPQFTTLTINTGGSIIPKAWKDTVISQVSYRLGGLVVIHAANIINNGTIKADGSGFRGGATPPNTAETWGTTLYVSGQIVDGGEKGEGISGYQSDYDIIGGRYGRGAPANGGGGGTAHNAGGGGGANGFNGNTWTGAGVMVVDANNLLAAWSLDPDFVANSNSLTNSSGGGRGGYTYGSQNGNANVDPPGASIWGPDYRRNVGGLGGRPLNNINPETRIYFGGGGGAGNANNNATPPAGNGGGIVYLIATTGISGTGTISANGNTAADTFSCNCDGASGAGAGGSIVIKATTLTGTQSTMANGGKGGDQLLGVPVTVNAEGPGGGGGGGFVATSAVGFVPVISGGANGISLGGGVTEMPANGSTRGATGQTVSVSASFVSFTQFVAPVLNNNGPLCAGNALNIFSNYPGPGINWTGPNSYTSAVQNPVINNAALQASGIYTLTISGGPGCPAVSSATTSVSIVMCTGIEEMTSGWVNIYPNPTKGEVYIYNNRKYDFLTVEVYNESGQLSFLTKVTPSSPLVDLTNKPAGIYLLRVLRDNYYPVHQVKIIKE